MRQVHHWSINSILWKEKMYQHRAISELPPETEVSVSGDSHSKTLHRRPVSFIMALCCWRLFFQWFTSYGQERVRSHYSEISLKLKAIHPPPSEGNSLSGEKNIFFTLSVLPSPPWGCSYSLSWWRNSHLYSRAARLKIKCGSSQCKKKKCRVQVQLEILLNIVALIPSPDVDIWN